MQLEHLHWNWIIFAIIKALRTFGLIPGAVAAFGLRKLYQKRRQKRAIEGWPSTEATIQSVRVHQEGVRSYWAEITYSYFVAEYRSGTYVRVFKREEAADNFARQVKDRRVQLHYKDSAPDVSVILERELDLIALLAPQLS